MHLPVLLHSPLHNPSAASHHAQPPLPPHRPTAVGYPCKGRAASTLKLKTGTYKCPKNRWCVKLYITADAPFWFDFASLNGAASKRGGEEARIRAGLCMLCCGRVVTAMNPPGPSKTGHPHAWQSQFAAFFGGAVSTTAASHARSRRQFAAALLLPQPRAASGEGEGEGYGGVLGSILDLNIATKRWAGRGAAPVGVGHLLGSGGLLGAGEQHVACVVRHGWWEWWVWVCSDRERVCPAVMFDRFNVLLIAHAV